MMTNGPEAGIGQILSVPVERPRQRLEVMEHPDYYRLRSELIGFLQQQRRLRQRRGNVAALVAGERVVATARGGVDAPIVRPGWWSTNTSAAWPVINAAMNCPCHRPAHNAMSRAL